MDRPADAKRRDELAKIHIAKTRLGMSDDDYRAMLRSVAGVDSASKLDARGRASVLAHLYKAGFRATKPNATPKDRAKRKSPASKIRALWLDLHGLGAVKDPSEAALSAFCHRMTGVDRAEWLNTDQANKVIEGLKDWRRRVILGRP